MAPRTKKKALPYVYGIGPNELTTKEKQKRMGLIEYRRIVVDAGDSFGHKVSAKKASKDEPWQLTVGCETRSIGQWRKTGKRVIIDNAPWDWGGTPDSVPGDGEEDDDFVDVTVDVELSSSGTLSCFDTAELSEEARAEIFKLALRDAMANDDARNDETHQGRLYQTLLSILTAVEEL